MEGRNHKVSILVPVYNVDAFIAKCAESLFKQTMPDLEFIFVDDNSQDRSIDVLKMIIAKYPNREKDVFIIHHSENRGLSAARNTALEKASAEYVFFIDSDDYLELDAISVLYNRAIRDSADIVQCGYTAVYRKYSREIYCENPIDVSEYLSEVLLRKANCNVCGKLFKRNLFQNIRFIDGVTFGEDYGTLPRVIYYAGSVSTVNVPLYNYVKYNTSSATSMIKQKSLEDAIIVKNNLCQFFTSVPDAHIYADIMQQAMLNFKVYMLKICRKKTAYLKRIAREWNNEGVKIVSKLPKNEQIVLYLLRNHNFVLLSICLRMGFCLLAIKKQLFRFTFLG